MWTQLGQLFGKAHFRENGNTAPELWDKAIASLSDKQIANGLGKLANDGLKFPPNLSMFVEACKFIPPHRHLGAQTPQLEDKRPPGRMSRAEYMRQNQKNGGEV